MGIALKSEFGLHCLMSIKTFLVMNFHVHRSCITKNSLPPPTIRLMMSRMPFCRSLQPIEGSNYTMRSYSATLMSKMGDRLFCWLYAIEI